MKQGNISLRAPEPEDLEVMLSFENDAALWELGTATGPYSRYQMKRYIAESQNDLYADGQKLPRASTFILSGNATFSFGR